MNFNLYLDDRTAKEFDRTAETLGKTRSELIRKVLREWLDKKTLRSPAGHRWLWSGKAYPTPRHSNRIAAKCFYVAAHTRANLNSQDTSIAS